MPLPPALAARLKKRGILTAAREAQGISEVTNSNLTLTLKGALDKCNIIPNLFQKKLGFLYH